MFSSRTTSTSPTGQSLSKAPYDFSLAPDFRAFLEHSIGMKQSYFYSSSSVSHLKKYEYCHQSMQDHQIIISNMTILHNITQCYNSITMLQNIAKYFMSIIILPSSKPSTLFNFLLSTAPFLKKNVWENIVRAFYASLTYWAAAVKIRIRLLHASYDIPRAISKPCVAIETCNGQAGLAPSCNYCIILCHIESYCIILRNIVNIDVILYNVPLYNAP